MDPNGPEWFKTGRNQLKWVGGIPKRVATSGFAMVRRRASLLFLGETMGDAMVADEVRDGSAPAVLADAGTGQTNTSQLSSGQSGSKRRGGWRMFGRAVLWTVAAGVAALASGFFLGVVFGATGLTKRLSSADLQAFYAIGGVLGASGLFLWAVARQSKADDAGIWAQLAAGPLARRWLLLLLGVVMTLYTTLITIGFFSAYPGQLAQVVGTDPVLYVAILAVTILLAPVAEELFFRGWLWTALGEYWSLTAVAFATGILFFAIHIPNGVAYAVLLVPLIVALSLARHYCGALRAPVLLHIWSNLVAVLAPWLGLWTGLLAWP